MVRIMKAGSGFTLYGESGLRRSPVSMENRQWYHSFRNTGKERRILIMEQRTAISFLLHDGTQVLVQPQEGGMYAFHLTRLNSERHNFNWIEASDEIEESYETRFDRLQLEAVDLFKKQYRH